MAQTKTLTRIIGPVLLLRALSIVIDRGHFIEMLRGLDREVATVSFSMFPIAFLMACIALAVLHTDTSSLAGILLRLMAWGGMLKASALILFPHAVAAKAQMLEHAGILNVVLAMSLLVGGYFTWFGYFRVPLAQRGGPLASTGLVG